MDHDDYDFQSQNFQLAGEDNIKFSPDSEVFFSIQGHASSWIEALSTGSSIVDFSPSAAESCSITKTNNVWSEATSTESVEMLLKSVGESEMTGNMDGNAHNLSGMDSQIDPSNEQPKSINSPTDSTVVPTEKDQSQSTCSGMTVGPEHSKMTDDPSSTQSQIDHFASFSMDEKGIVNKHLSPSQKTSERCPTAVNYFEAVHDDHSLDRLNMPSAELDSRKFNNEPFPELAPLQNIYVTDSYNFEHVNQESEVCVPQDSDICHIRESNEGGLHDLQNLTHTGDPLGAVNLSSRVSNETLLPGSSDGLLEAITKPVKMLQGNDGTCKTVSGTLQPLFSPVHQTVESLKCSVDMSNELMDKEFGFGSNSALSHQSEPNLKILNPHHNTSIPVESNKMSLSPKRKLDHGTCIPEETKNAGADSMNIFSGDESKNVVLGDRQGSVDNPKTGAMEEKKIREDISEFSGNIEQMVENDHEENVTCGTYTSNDKFGTSENIASDALRTSENPKIPSVNHEGSFKEGDTPALEEPENTHLVVTGSGPQENIPATLVSSSSHIISTTVTDTFSGLKGKIDHSGDVSHSLDNIALDVFHTSENTKNPLVNHEGSFKEGVGPALEGPQNTHLVLTGSGPQEKISTPLVSSSSHIICTTVTDTLSGLKGKNDRSEDVSRSLDNIAADAFHTSENTKNPLVNHEGPFKEGVRPALEGPQNTHCVLTGSGPQEKISTPQVSSSTRIISTTVTDTFSGLKGKNDHLEDVSPDDASAVLPNVKDSRMSTMNHESFKGDAKSTLEDEDHQVISPDSKPGAEIPAISMNPNIDVFCSDAASFAKNDKEHAISMGGLRTGETQDKSCNHPDVRSEKCQTGGSSVQSECCIDLATPSILCTSSEKTKEKTLLNARDDLDPHVQDTVLNHGTGCSPGSVMSQAKLGSTGDGICADATCGSPSMSSCTEPSPQKVGRGRSILPHQTQVEQPENMTDNEASAGATHKLKESSNSNRNVESTVASEDANTARGDRSFSFAVGAPPNVTEKAHNPAWRPFPSFSALQSIEVTTENPQPKSSGKSSNNSSDDNKKTSAAEAGMEQLPERKVAESSAEPRDESKIGDITKISPLGPSRQHSTPECSNLVNLPFTDSQHVQLRAQIFVYGALIQGRPPGEAYMVAAFGEPVGGGKPTWEAAWQAALKRFQCQKSIYTGLETPTSSHFGSVSEKTTKGAAVKTAQDSKEGGKSVLPGHSSIPQRSPTAHPSSSTFNLQQGTHLDFSQAVSPVFAYNSHMRHPSFVASWYLQSPGPRAAPLLVQPQNLIFDSSTQPAVPTSETLKGPSSKNASVSNAVSRGIFPPILAAPIVSPLTVVHEEKQKALTSISKGTSSQKPRKRKKSSASPEQQPVIASPQLTTDMVSFTPAAKHSSSFTLSTHAPSNALASRLVPNIEQTTSVPNYQITGSVDAEQRIILPEQIRGAIEQSTGQAKGASLHSVEAVRHKESVWGHLPTVPRNKIPPEVEEKLTSATAAAEAAVSVAKAAAEAAKMASEAAFQAKMMAAEALSSFKSINPLQNLEVGGVDVNTNLTSLLSSPPASSWKIKDTSHASGSIVSVAREVARKRVEEASAAAKRAENLDVILKAAELAAEAVFNAGTIIGMGEPLPFTLSELLEGGPDGFWKSDRVRNIKAGNVNGNLLTETLQVDVPADSNKSGKKCGREPKSVKSVLNSDPSSSARELQPDGMASGHGVKVIPATSDDGQNNNPALTSIIWNGIEKGSAVEVSSYVGGFGVAWFSAKVVDMNEDRALISYDNHNEGTHPHEEWVPLKLEGDKAPQIRLAHPATLSKFKTRKRRRETCFWVIGDHVDACLNDRWREGVIAQNFEAEETKFVVQFSDGANPLVVDACNLRPSLVWEDGHWTEWSRAKERKSKPNKGDSPLEKRQRTDPLQAGIDEPFGEAGGPSKDRSTNNSKKPEEVKPLALSQRDMVFNIGKSVTENKTDALAFKRPGLQKEGSKVFYGVPKHGKKKKFMEVSKHYVTGQSDRTSEDKSSSRDAKHMVPPLPRSRNSTLKTDQRGRRVGEIRSRGPPKPSKSQTVSANTIPDQDSLPMPAPNPGVFERNCAFGESVSTSNTEKFTVDKNNSALGPVPRIEALSVTEMQACSTYKQDVPTTNRTKRTHIPSVDSRSIRKPSERTTDSAEEPRRTSSDSAEPRRSNRRIQPTSRLLEGLQSSLIVSKIPGEKGPRSHFRSTTSRGRAHG